MDEVVEVMVLCLCGERPLWWIEVRSESTSAPAQGSHVTFADACTWNESGCEYEAISLRSVLGTCSVTPSQYGYAA